MRTVNANALWLGQQDSLDQGHARRVAVLEELGIGFVPFGPFGPFGPLGKGFLTGAIDEKLHRLDENMGADIPAVWSNER